MLTIDDSCLKPLKYTQPIDAHPHAYRIPTPGTRDDMEVKLTEARTNHQRLTSELAEKEAARDTLNARRESLITERAAASENREDDITAVARGTATIDEVAVKQARLAIVEAAIPIVSTDLWHHNGLVKDAHGLARDAGREVRDLEADLILLDLTEALTQSPFSETLKIYFEKSGDAALLLRPAETRIDADD